MILLDTTIPVHYRFLILHSRAADGAEDVTAGMGGQLNGLCGARVPGELSMVTGMHTGEVHVTVEVHEVEPPLGDEWEEAVEHRDATGELPSLADRVAAVRESREERLAAEERAGAEGWFHTGPPYRDYLGE